MHVEACAMEDRAAHQQEKDLIPSDELERRSEKGMMKMTLGGVKQHLLYCLIAQGIQPRKLGRRYSQGEFVRRPAG